jgi:hypothetical protein
LKILKFFILLLYFQVICRRLDQKWAAADCRAVSMHAKSFVVSFSPYQLIRLATTSESERQLTAGQRGNLP